MKKMNFRIAACLTLLAAAVTSGCFGFGGFTLGIFSVPVPVSPYFQGAYEDMAFEQDRYSQVPVLPPIVDGTPEGMDAPSDDEVIRLLEKAKPDNGGVPFLETRYRNRFTTSTGSAPFTSNRTFASVGRFRTPWKRKTLPKLSTSIKTISTPLNRI